MDLIKKIKDNIDKPIILDEYECISIINALKLVNAYNEILDQSIQEQIDKL